MDPLSLVASCISIVQGIEMLYKLVKENVNSSTAVKSQLGALLAKCSACKGIIEGIKLQAEIDKDDISRLQLLDHVGEPIHALEIAIQLINEKLKSLPRKIVIGKVVNSSIESCLKTFDDTLRILQLALQVDQISIAKVANNYALDVKSDIRDLNIAIDHLSKDVSELVLLTSEQLLLQRSHQDEGTRLKIKQWLSSVDEMQIYLSLTEKAHPGTGAWFLDKTLNQWLQQNEKPRRTLWLHGRSGAGKTTLLSSVITNLSLKEKHPAMAYFFCSVSMDDTRNPTNMLGSMVVQLCNQRPELWHFVVSWRDNITRQQGMLRKPQTDEVAAIFTKICKNFDEVLLILDAPNECESPKRVLNTIGDLISELPHLKVLISTTPDLDSSALKYDDILYVRMDSTQINSDIGDCIRSKMEREEQLQDFPDYLKARIIAKLLERADGSFRWAECQLSAIVDNATSEAGVNQALDNLSLNLETLYTNILTTVPTQQAKLLRNALLWLVFAVRSLHIDELREAMILKEDSSTVDQIERLLPGKAENLLSKCRMLVNYDAVGKRVSLAHSSVRDFLLSNSCRLGKASYFYLEFDASLCSLTCLSVNYLNMEILGSGYVSSRTAYADRLQKCPLLLYASDAWPIFSKYVAWYVDNYRLRTEKVLQAFFDSSQQIRGGNYASWIQVYEPRHLRFQLNVAEHQHLSEPLYYAARSGLREVASMIIRVYGKEALNMPGGSRSSTPLHVAAAYGHSTMVEMLLQQGADPNERNRYGERGAAWAEYYGYKDIVQMYLDHGADALSDEDRAAIPRPNAPPKIIN